MTNALRRSVIFVIETLCFSQSFDGKQYASQVFIIFLPIITGRAVSSLTVYEAQNIPV